MEICRHYNHTAHNVRRCVIYRAQPSSNSSSRFTAQTSIESINTLIEGTMTVYSTGCTGARDPFVYLHRAICCMEWMAATFVEWRHGPTKMWWYRRRRRLIQSYHAIRRRCQNASPGIYSITYILSTSMPRIDVLYLAMTMFQVRKLIQFWFYILLRLHIGWFNHFNGCAMLCVGCCVHCEPIHHLQWWIIIIGFCVVTHISTRHK